MARCTSGQWRYPCQPFCSPSGLADLIIFAKTSDFELLNREDAQCSLPASHNIPMNLIGMDHQDVLSFLQHRIAIDSQSDNWKSQVLLSKGRSQFCSLERSVVNFTP